MAANARRVALEVTTPCNTTAMAAQESVQEECPKEWMLMLMFADIRTEGECDMRMRV